jgi:NitT/TauT family transport system permease protein
MSVSLRRDDHARKALAIGSFLLPILVWCIVSYVPFVWHPKMLRSRRSGASIISSPACWSTASVFADQTAADARAGAGPSGRSCPPTRSTCRRRIEVAMRPLYRFHQAAPEQKDALAAREPVAQHPGHLLGLCSSPPWWACRWASSAAPTRGCTAHRAVHRILPLPARPRLRRAGRRGLGIYDGPKIAIIVIGTFFQQVLVIANTTRKLDATIIEAARTLGATRGLRLITQVVSPASCPTSTATSASCWAGPGPTSSSPS